MGAFSWPSHLMIFVGMPGWDQGSTSLAWMMPPFPQLVSMAASAWRSISTTSWPDFRRYQAVAVPTTPAPRTTVFIVCLPLSTPLVASRPALRRRARGPSRVFGLPDRLALAGRDFRRLALPAAGPGARRPHGFPFALDPAGNVARDLTQDLVRQALGFAIELADQAQMAGHFMEGAHRIARRHGFVDRGVIANRELIRVGHVDRRRPLIDQPSDQGVVNACEHRIARDHREFVVEGHIGAYEDSRIADGGSVGVERRLQAQDILVGGDPGRLPGDPGLEQQAGLLHVFVALAGRSHAPDQACQLAGEEFSRGRGHACPRSAGDLHQALLLQDEQRLPHRGAAYPEALRQLLLGGQRAALLELAGRYRALNVLGDLVGALASAKRHRGHGSLRCGSSK